MSKITYGSPVDEFGPVCPQQFFKPISEPVHPGNVTDAALLLVNQAQGIANMLSADDGAIIDMVRDHAVQGIYAIEGILDQLEVLLQHPIKEAKHGVRKSNCLAKQQAKEVTPC